MTDSISQTENPIDDTIKTAVFYSVSDLGNYLVEIRHQQQDYFIQDAGQSKQFENMATAKKAALAEGAEQGYQALSRAYQEVEAITAHSSASEDAQKFDYVRLDLKDAETSTESETQVVFS